MIGVRFLIKSDNSLPTHVVILSIQIIGLKGHCLRISAPWIACYHFVHLSMQATLSHIIQLLLQPEVLRSDQGTKLF